MRRATIHLDVYTAVVLLFYVAVTLLMSVCQSQQPHQNQSIKIDGSSTVYPMTEAIIEQFNPDPLKKVGTAFGGQAEFTMAIDEILSQTTEY